MGSTMKAFFGYIGMFFLHILCIPVFFVLVVVGIVKGLADWKDFGGRS